MVCEFCHQVHMRLAFLAVLGVGGIPLLLQDLCLVGRWAPRPFVLHALLGACWVALRVRSGFSAALSCCVKQRVIMRGVRPVVYELEGPPKWESCLTGGLGAVGVPGLRRLGPGLESARGVSSLSSPLVVLLCV